MMQCLIALEDDRRSENALDLSFMYLIPCKLYPRTKGDLIGLRTVVWSNRRRYHRLLDRVGTPRISATCDFTVGVKSSATMKATPSWPFVEAGEAEAGKPKKIAHGSLIGDPFIFDTPSRSRVVVPKSYELGDGVPTGVGGLYPPRFKAVAQKRCQTCLHTNIATNPLCSSLINSYWA
jgi:hypothetical protein